VLPRDYDNYNGVEDIYRSKNASGGRLGGGGERFLPGFNRHSVGGPIKSPTKLPETIHRSKRRVDVFREYLSEANHCVIWQRRGGRLDDMVRRRLKPSILAIQSILRRAGPQKLLGRRSIGANATVYGIQYASPRDINSDQWQSMPAKPRTSEAPPLQKIMSAKSAKHAWRQKNSIFKFCIDRRTGWCTCLPCHAVPDVVLLWLEKD
jgi:hypothetical protein